MSNEFQDIYVDNVHPMPSSAQRLTYRSGIVYANPWPSLVSGGPITINPSELLAGGLVANFSAGSSLVTWPDVDGIASELGMSSVTGYVFDYFVVNNSQQEMEFTLGEGMVLIGTPDLVVPAQSTASFRFVGFDTGFNGADLAMSVSRIH